MWMTHVYWIPLKDRIGQIHKIFAFKMDTITAPLEPVDVQAAKGIFPKLILKQSKDQLGGLIFSLAFKKLAFSPLLLIGTSILIRISDS